MNACLEGSENRWKAGIILITRTIIEVQISINIDIGNILKMKGYKTITPETVFEEQPFKLLLDESMGDCVASSQIWNSLE